MGFWDFLRRPEADDQTVVFSGDRWEAEMVIHLLKGEGFHPLEWADMPGPYIGPIGMARVIVPPEESQAAKQFLVSLKDRGFQIEDMEGAGEDEQDEQDEE